jgi:cation diffusion facilitator CzcD-associated flavoprotein CzcO
VEQPTAFIIGGGPAGLTIADELLSRTDIHPCRADKSNLWDVNTKQDCENRKS